MGDIFMVRAIIIGLVLAFSAVTWGQIPAPIVLKQNQEISFSGNVGDSVQCSGKTYDKHNFNITIVQEPCNCDGGFSSRIYSDGLFVGACKTEPKISKEKDPQGFINLPFLENLSDKEVIKLFSNSLVGSCQMMGNEIFVVKGYEKKDALKSVWSSFLAQNSDELHEKESSEVVIAKSLREIVKLKLCGVYSEELLKKKMKDQNRILGQNDLAFNYFIAQGKNGEELAEMQFPVSKLRKRFNFTAADFKGFKYNAYQLKAGGFTAQELKDAKYSLSDLASAGFDAKKELKPIFTISEFKSAGYNAYNLKNLDFSAAEVKASGFTLSDLASGGFDAKSELKPLYSIADFKSAGYNAYNLKNIEYSAKELKASGLFTLSDLASAGFDAKTELKPIFKIADFKSAGYSAYNLKNLEYSAKELKASGSSLSDLASAGFEAKVDLKPIFTIEDFKLAGYSAYNLKNLDYTATQMKASGYSLSDLVSAGYDAKSELKPIFTIHEFKSAGYSAYNLKNLDYSAAELKKASFKLADLANAGFDVKDELKSQFPVSDFKSAGYSAYNMKNFGFAAKELLSGGYTISEVNSAGYSDEEILK